MSDVSSLWLFAAAALALAVIPGPAVLYIVTRSVSQGRLAGVVSCLGVAVGGMVHVLAAAAGLSAVLATSALAFNIVKYAGAAYLLWLGIQRLTRSPRADAEAAAEAHSLQRIFRDGIVVNVLNPKTALFFLAFLPQFVVPAKGHVPLQCAALGGLFVVIAMCTDATWSLAASGAGSWLKRHPGFVAAERYIAGGTYITLGLAAAVSGHGRK
jgi:threonine/homoserine/homoserine lactone efflux protein